MLSYENTFDGIKKAGDESEVKIVFSITDETDHEMADMSNNLVDEGLGEQDVSMPSPFGISEYDGLVVPAEVGIIGLVDKHVLELYEK